ncbi:MAG: hypothetical protein KDB66_04405 [Solirubrobacterales bacterium]|nr:hypothetical protein [Solirubrobacterales bacterium]MCB8915586.1 hypothetical protein [Thermoleophilales bacterium]
MRILRRVLGLAFIGVGILHFVRPKFFLAIMPPWIPMHREAVAVSGAAEIAGGAAMLSDVTAKPAGLWLTALLIAVFPANVHMAIDRGQIDRMAKTGVPKWALYARLPLQPALIYLVLKSTRSGTQQVV